MPTSITQRVQLDAPPAVIYEMLMASRRHAGFTGEPARISRREGGRFSAYSEYITGVNVELVPGRRIVQAWRGSDWPAGAHSIVTFALSPAAGRRTRLTFTQHGVPAAQLRSIRQGWIDFYWDPMKAAVRDATSTATRATR